MPENAEVRRREATRAMLRYFALSFLIACAISAAVVYAVMDSRHQRAASRAVRIEYCLELEKLKTQNREDVAKAKHDYRRNLRLLGLKDTPELRKASEESWAIKMARNAPKPCPYGG